jgi:hypothetical protein
MRYYTIKDIERMVENAHLRIMDVYQENKWVIVVLSSNVKIKFRNF